MPRSSSTGGRAFPSPALATRGWGGRESAPRLLNANTGNLSSETPSRNRFTPRNQGKINTLKQQRVCGSAISPPPRPTDQAPLPRRGVGRVKLLKCSRGQTRGGALRNPLPHTHSQPPHPPANRYKPRKVSQSFILAGWRWLPWPGAMWGEPGGRERSRHWVLLHHPWEKLPSGAKTYGRWRPMGPRRKITAAHSAANPRGPRTMALVCVSPLPRGYVSLPPHPSWLGRG